MERAQSRTENEKRNGMEKDKRKKKEMKWARKARRQEEYPREQEDASYTSSTQWKNGRLFIYAYGRLRLQPSRRANDWKFKTEVDGRNAAKTKT